MKLNEIQQKLKAPKSQFNSFGKYSYRNAEDILEAVKPLLGDNLLTLSDEVVNIGNRNYVKATATFLEYHDEKSQVNLPAEFKVAAFACESEDRKGMDAAQITGAASSYARKYALNGLFLIDDTKDADSDDNTSKPAPQSRQTARSSTKAASPKKDQATELKAAKDRTISLLKLLGYTELKTKAAYEEAVGDLTGLDLTDGNLEAINEKLSGLLEAREATQEANK